MDMIATCMRRAAVNDTAVLLVVIVIRTRQQMLGDLLPSVSACVCHAQETGIRRGLAGVLAAAATLAVFLNSRIVI